MGGQATTVYLPLAHKRVARLRHCVAVIAMVAGCGSSSKGPGLQEPAKEAPVVEKTPPCREAVHEESRLLVSALGETDAPQGLAIQLDELAASLDITWEVVATLRQLRATARKLTAPKHVVELDTAAKTVERACAKLDLPEERAKSALDGAIKLLAEEKYEETLETYIPPVDLAQIKKAGQFPATVERFRNGAGQKLHAQLVRARKSAPARQPDGSVEFRARGKVGESDERIVLESIGGRWFFRQ